MRIALFHNLPSGGAKRAIFEWVHRLAERHEIFVFSLSTADHEFCDLRPYVKKYVVYPFKSRRIFNSPFGRLNQFQRWRDLGDLDDLNRQIAKDIDQGNWDVVFANTCMYTFIPALLKYLHKPAIYYLHEPFGPSFVRSFHRPYFKEDRLRNVLDQHDPLIRLFRSRLLTIQQDSIGHTRYLLANSRFTQEQIAAEFSVKTFVCPYGVDLEKFFPRPGIQKDYWVVSVGELSPRKGFDFVIESIANIPLDRRPALKLASNVVQPQERKYIENLALMRKVDLQILTALNSGELRALYNRAKLCVYAPQMEPFGLVPLEAMACGTPVVGIREGGVQESIVDGYSGLLIDRNPLEFGKAIDSLLADQGLLKQYGLNARSHVEQNWSWEKSTDQLEKYLYETQVL